MSFPLSCNIFVSFPFSCNMVGSYHLTSPIQNTTKIKIGFEFGMQDQQFFIWKDIDNFLYRTKSAIFYIRKMGKLQKMTGNLTISAPREPRYWKKSLSNPRGNRNKTKGSRAEEKNSV